MHRPHWGSSSSTPVAQVEARRQGHGGGKTQCRSRQHQQGVQPGFLCLKVVPVVHHVEQLEQPA